MHKVFKDLMSSLGLDAGHANQDGELWLRADQRYDICASWVDEEHSLQLTAIVRPAVDDTDFMADIDADDDGDEWDCEDSQEGAWEHTTLWHLPSSFVALTARAEGRQLDATSLPDFIGSFIDQVQRLEEQLDRRADQSAMGGHHHHFSMGE